MRYPKFRGKQSNIDKVFDLLSELSEIAMSSTRNFSSRHRPDDRKRPSSGGVYPTAPDVTLRREVTQNEVEIGSTIRPNYSENTDEYYSHSNTNSNGKKDSEIRRSFREESPLVFQSTLSSLSKEDTGSSDGMEDINLSNTDSIFRPRQDSSKSTRKQKTEHLPNLLSHSNLEKNAKRNKVS